MKTISSMLLLSLLFLIAGCQKTVPVPSACGDDSRYQSRQILSGQSCVVFSGDSVIAWNQEISPIDAGTLRSIPASRDIPSVIWGDDSRVFWMNRVLSGVDAKNYVLYTGFDNYMRGTDGVGVWRKDVFMTGISPVGFTGLGEGDEYYADTNAIWYVTDDLTVMLSGVDRASFVVTSPQWAEDAYAIYYRGERRKK